MDCNILYRMVAMRDGVKLHTVVYMPDDDRKHPVVLVRSPYYPQDNIAMPNEEHLEKGIIFISQACRGTGKSEGEFYPWHNEINDGEDCLKWISAQSWCDGRIVMDGSSYPGGTQWYAAFSSNPALLGIAPHVAPANCYDSPNYVGGAFCLELSMEWGLGMHYRNGGYPEMDLDWKKLVRHLPLKDIDKEAGLRKVDFWHDWLEHNSYGPYWEATDLNKHYQKIKIPVYVSGGWFDIYSKATLENFVGMKTRAGSEKARKLTRCVIGPWSHGELVESMDCGENASLEDAFKIRAEFLKNILEDPDSDPLPGEPPLKYFMMGKNEWRKSDTWPVKGIVETEYFLHSSGSANTRFGDGYLDRTAPSDEAADVFIYDPHNPVPTNGGCTLCIERGVFDQRQVEERNDVLVFSTAALTEDIEVAGNIKLILYAATNCLDTDFTAKLVDVYPDGQALNLCDGIIRARHRDSLENSKLLEKNKIYEYDIDCWVTANCFLKGHKIRIEVSSSNFPRFDRNPNTGHKFAEDSELKIASQTIYHDSKHPSRLILPVLAN